MEPRAHHADGPAPDGVVKRMSGRAVTRAVSRAGAGVALRDSAVLLARPALGLGVAALLLGVLGGLLRVGLALPGTVAAPVVGHAAVSHAALMLCAFFGTVIGVERAVALKHLLAFMPPLAAGLGGVITLLGQPALGAVYFAIASLLFVAVNVMVLRRQRASHTVLLLLGALAWCAGSLLQLLRPGDPASLAWWFGFLVLTIAAERLEMTRLMRRRAAAQPLLLGVVAGMLGGAALSMATPAAGGVLYGLSLVALALWLALFDIARRTVLAEGLARYMAMCLLAGYAWLAVGGLAWAAHAAGEAALRDTALHAIGLGFVFSMVMGHAPVILPAVARLKLRFSTAFYLPLLLLHASLLLRLAAGAADPQAKAWGAALNAAAMLVFIVTMVRAVLAWRAAERAGDTTA